MEEKKAKKESRYRIFNISQMEKHPVSGEVLLTEEKIKQTLEKYKSLTQWAWCIHDRDVYTFEDEDKNPEHKAGTKKPKHFHIVISCDNAQEISKISKWFGIPPQYIELPYGRGKSAFTDCVEYLTHEADKQQDLGKALYTDEEIHANFDFRLLIKAKYMKEYEKAEKGIFSSDLEKYMYQVLYKGMTLRQVGAEMPFLYGENIAKFDRWRKKYLELYAPLPPNRLNYYISGNSGEGKGYLSRALARTLARQYFGFDESSRDDEMFFQVGAKNTTFQGYDGQPIIIWDDCRGYELMEILGGRGNVFDVFEITPSNKTQNIKHGAIRLTNCVNIVNSVQSLVDFKKDLCAEYIDKDGRRHGKESIDQVSRRFPLTGILEETAFEFYINCGFLNVGSYDDYISLQKFKFGMRQLIADCHGDEKAITSVIRNEAARLLKQHGDFSKRTKELTDGEIDEILERYSGMNIIDVEENQIVMELPEELTEEEKAELPF